MAVTNLNHLTGHDQRTCVGYQCCSGGVRGSGAGLKRLCATVTATPPFRFLRGRNGRIRWPFAPNGLRSGELHDR